MPENKDFFFSVDERDAGMRLDILVSDRSEDLSRSRASSLIQQGAVRVDDAVKKPGYRVASGEIIFVEHLPPKPSVFKPEPIDIDILYEDDQVIVVNKPPGMVVHPGPGHFSGTLVNALLYHCPDLQGIGDELRPGIVHRLDRDTSGVLIVAKNSASHRSLSEQFKTRCIKKTYLALVHGIMGNESGAISLSIGRHPVDRKKMSVNSRRSRDAETSWQVKETFDDMSLLEINLKTGRTHQIRVHFAAIHHGIVGDPVYGGRKKRTACLKSADSKRYVGAVPLRRQMLHARRLEFIHPSTGETVAVDAAIPDDMQQVIDALRKTEKRFQNPI
jgi:23S rRNA pseudouridine1911/1915/1917 synthase